MKINVERIKAVFYIAATVGIIIYSWQIIGGYFSQVNIVSAFVPLFIGLVIAYILSPLVMFLERFKLKRWLALITVYVVVFSIVALLLRLLTPLLIKNISDFIASLPGFTRYWVQLVEDLNISFPGFDLEAQLETALGRMVDIATSLGFNLVNNLINIVGDSLASAVNLLMGIFISIYFIIDRELIFKSFGNICPKKYRKQAGEYLGIIHGVFASYMRGLLIMIAINGALAYVGFSIVQVRYSLIIAIMVGLLQVIPILGAWLGLIPAVLFAVMDGPQKAIITCIVYFILQQLDGNVIAPKVYGDQVGVHPVFVLIGITVFGQMFGIAGMLVSVPVMGIIKLCYIKIRAQYEAQKQNVTQKPSLKQPQQPPKQPPPKSSKASR